MRIVEEETLITDISEEEKHEKIAEMHVAITISKALYNNTRETFIKIFPLYRKEIAITARNIKPKDPMVLFITGFAGYVNAMEKPDSSAAKRYLIFVFASRKQSANINKNRGGKMQAIISKTL